MSGSTPDITPAQVAAIVSATVAELVTFGLLDGRTAHLIVGLAGVLVPAAWMLADAIIRHGRSRALAPAPVLAAAASLPAAPPAAPPAA